MYVVTGGFFLPLFSDSGPHMPPSMTSASGSAFLIALPAALTNLA